MLLNVERQLVGLPWAADSCPWVGKLRTMLPLTRGWRVRAHPQICMKLLGRIYPDRP
jgi:hypothetical protein